MSFRSSVFDSDSEYKQLRLIHSRDSYNLNPIITEDITWQIGMMVEVIGVTKRLRTVEKTGRLDDLLLSVVDETMLQVFREAGTKAIYDYLENKYHLKREEIAEKPEVFSAGLERLMVSAAQMIEKLILKNLYRKLGLKFEEKKGYEFSDYIKELRKSAVVKA